MSAVTSEALGTSALAVVGLAILVRWLWLEWLRSNR